MPAPETVVAICIPIFDHPKLQFFRSFKVMRKPHRASTHLPGVTHTLDVAGYAVDTARQLLTMDALAAEPRVTHVLWIDDDMEMPADALERLLKHDLPIIGGLCHARRPPYHPILAKKHDPVWGYNEGSYGFVYEYPKNALVEVDATGAGFLLVKREVFEAIDAEFGAEKWWEPIGSDSEDFSFCHRARKCGFAIKVDTSLEIGHVADVVITSDIAKRLRPGAVNRWAPADLRQTEMAGKPRASIVIPTYNQTPTFLKAAVFSALAQTVPVEVIVVDDGTDKYCLRGPPAEGTHDGGCHEHEGRPTVRLPHGAKLVAHERNKGIADALNTGIRAMTTDWFCWLSSDDLFDPRKVEMQLGELARSGHKAGFHRYNALYQGRGDKLAQYALAPEWRTMEEQQRMLAEHCVINGSTVMLHRSVFDAVGLFDPEYLYGQDWQMWRRVAQKFFWWRTDEFLGVRREGGGNLTAEIAAEEADSARRQRRDEEDRRIRAMPLS